MEDTIEELQDAVNSLTEENNELQETIDDLQQEFEEYTTNTTRRLEALEYQIKKLANMSYKYDRNQDTFQLQARITREVLENCGTVALDAVYSNMKEEMMRHVKYPNTIPPHLKTW
jgi:chromosome segregation ATPase